MDREQFLQAILPYLSGQQNISRQVWKGNKLCVTVKDVGAVQLEALEGMDIVAAVELDRGRVTVTPQGLEQQEDIMATDKNKQIAQDVLAAVGGKGNVAQATHCMTRLRLNLKDETIPNDEEVKNIKGVLGVVRAGGQYQIIIGQNVPKVYAEVCSLTGLAAQDAIKENLDAPKEKLTPKKIGSNILNYMAGSLTPLIPVLMASGMFKTVLVIFTDLLHILPADSDLYTMFNFMYNAGMYFLPIYAGYHAAKKLGATPVLGMYLGGILIAPGLLAAVSTGEPFAPLGFAMSLRNYSSTILPIILGVAVMAYIEKFFKKVVPDTLSTIFVPMLTILVATPLALYLLGPAGYIFGDYLAIVLNALGNYTGFIGIAIIAALWEYLVMSGMHIVLLMPVMSIVMAGGVDPVIFVAAKNATFAAIGMALGTFLAMKEKDEKTTNLGFFISGFVGGVTEPVLYGTGFKYKRPFLCMSAGAAIGGAIAGILGVEANLMAASNVLGILAFSGGTPTNFAFGAAACFISLIASAVITFLFGYSKEERETGCPRSN